MANILKKREIEGVYCSQKLMDAFSSDSCPVLGISICKLQVSYPASAVCLYSGSKL